MCVCVFTYDHFRHERYSSHTSHTSHTCAGMWLQVFGNGARDLDFWRGKARCESSCYSWYLNMVGMVMGMVVMVVEVSDDHDGGDTPNDRGG